MAVGPALLQAAADNDPAAVEMIVQWAHSPAAHFGGNRAPGLWLAGGARRLLEQSAPGVLYNDLNACNAYQDGLASAAKLQCPALFLLGAKDLMTPAKAARQVIASVAQAQQLLIPNCGHMMMSEKPDETLDALIDFSRLVRSEAG
jgi:pimeloyl-ACP methyl ester carboxylesterase